MTKLQKLTFVTMFEIIGQPLYGEIVTGRNAVKMKISFGSTNSKLVARAIRREERWLKKKIKF